MQTNTFSLEGKSIVVTGATGILGHSFVRFLAQAGAAVGILGRNEEKANERVAEITSEGGKAIALIADVLNKEQLTAAKDAVIARFGKIDGLVNGAGGNMKAALVEPGEDVFAANTDALKQVMDLNLWGSVLPTMIFGKSIADNGGGSIVNISSVSADRTLTKVFGYSMAKSAIESFNKWFAVELANRYGDKIRMNAIVPGFFLTEQNRAMLTNADGSLTQRGQTIIQQTPFNRFGRPDELGGALVWLMSDASSFVNGTTITIDGGFSAFSGV